MEEVELGGLEDDEEDLGAVGFNEEGLQLEREEVAKSVIYVVLNHSF